MKRIEGLGVDMRSKIHRENWAIGVEPNKTSVTFHYNGPAIAGVERWTDERMLRFINEVDVPNHISRIGADGLQYHFIVKADGTIWQTRDLDAVLWHCANWTGNHQSVAVHFPIGDAQTPTPAQWGAAIGLFKRLQAEFKMPSADKALFGHQEWQGANTACPGRPMMALIRAFRDAPDVQTKEVKTVEKYRVLRPANVREEPDHIRGKIAWGGKLVLQPGTEIEIDEVVRGTWVAGTRNWGHMKSGDGFIHMSLLGK